jgi:WhiB family transcriptional regulator, redox-sensing transcriptional regulator
MAVLARDQMRLSLSASPDGSVGYLRIQGDVDLSDTPALGLAAQRLIADNAGLVYVDLGGITFMGSTLIGFLVHVANSGRAQRRLVLCRPTPTGRRVIRMTSLDGIATMSPDLPPSWPDDAQSQPGPPRRPQPVAESEGPPDWRASAACRNEDPDLFFPVGTTDFVLGQIREAKAVCGRCPVQQPCLDWALSSGPIGHAAGVCAGLCEDELRARKRLAARAPQPGLAGPVALQTRATNVV